MKRTFIFYLAMIISIIASGQNLINQNLQGNLPITATPTSSNEETKFTFVVQDKNIINNDLTRIMSIDNVVKLSESQGYKVTAYANPAEFSEFLTRNIPYQIIVDNSPTALTMATTRADMWSWDKYPTYSVYEQMMAYFASTYPSICDIDTILTATQSGNFKILVAHISDNVHSVENEPQFLYSSSIHGDETTGYYLMLRLINYLLSNYGTISKVTNLVNNVDIWICPSANPEGTYYNYSPAGSNVVNARRANLAGIDLNRNFPDPINGYNPDGNATQPETQGFIDFAYAHHFNMAANFHGGTEIMNYPWDSWTTAGNLNADAAWWERVCTAYVDTTRLTTPTYFTVLYADGVTEGGDWYVVSGGRQDYMNWVHKCREVTAELDATKLTETAH